jgi:hypothetical protein
MSAMAARLPESDHSPFHHVATFAIGKADPESRLSGVAHLQTFKAHVKLASMEGDCDCLGHFSSS